MRAYIDAPNDDCYLIARWSILLGLLPSKLPVAKTSCIFLSFVEGREYQRGERCGEGRGLGVVKGSRRVTVLEWGRN